VVIGLARRSWFIAVAAIGNEEARKRRGATVSHLEAVEAKP
jgi:hypothetical protein